MNKILDLINEANYNIEDLKELIEKSKDYTQKEKYLKIIDNMINDLEVLYASVSYEDKVNSNPKLAKKVLFN